MQVSVFVHVHTCIKQMHTHTIPHRTVLTKLGKTTLNPTGTNGLQVVWPPGFFGHHGCAMAPGSSR